jgi:hypothetical protein
MGRCGTMPDIAARRLLAQRLVGERFESPVEAVRELGAVQSQDYGAARWALGLRTGAAAAEIDRLFDEGAILRTHVLRPTWHFLVPEVLDQLLRLTGPRIRAGMASRHRVLELDAATITRACSAFEAALGGGRHLTRAELGEVLTGSGISPEGQRVPHLLTCAELEGLVTSGPRRGRQFTWALFDERAPRIVSFDREAVKADLAGRYFRSHGPAQLRDFTWWSGLSAREARKAIDLVPALRRETVDGKEYWSGEGAGRSPSSELTAHLLPNFDEFLVAYRDRSAALEPGLEYDPSLLSFGNILSNVVLVGGKVRGAWRKKARGGVDLALFGALSAAERGAVEEAAKAARTFLEAAS